MVAGVLPIRVLMRVLTYQAASKSQAPTKALNASNRPVTADHWKAIADYLEKAVKGQENTLFHQFPSMLRVALKSMFRKIAGDSAEWLQVALCYLKSKF